MFEKYKLYYAEKEFKIKQNILNEKKTKKYLFLKPSTLHDPINDKITKEHKLKSFNQYIFWKEKFLRDNLSQDKSLIKNFLI